MNKTFLKKKYDKALNPQLHNLSRHLFIFMLFHIIFVQSISQMAILCWMGSQNPRKTKHIPIHQRNH